MKTFAVYKIHNIETNMDYIGWSGDPISRVFEQHEKTNSYIGNAICSYGWDAFDVDVLHLVKTKEEACKLEIEEIAKHNCQAPNGYNLTKGGDGSFGRECSLVTRKKLSKVMEGKKKSKEHKKNMGGIKKPGTSKALRGNKYSQGFKRSKKSELKRVISNLKNRVTKLEKELESE